MLLLAFLIAAVTVPSALSSDDVDAASEPKKLVQMDLTLNKNRNGKPYQEADFYLLSRSHDAHLDQYR